MKSLNKCAWLPASLIRLELSENQIEDIEDLVWSLALRCPSIQIFRVAQNRLKRIPLEMGLLFESKLSKIDLRMNPQQAVRHSILERECQEQLSYLKNRMTKEEAAASAHRLVMLQDAFQAEEQSLPRSTFMAKKSDHKSGSTAALAKCIALPTQNSQDPKQSEDSRELRVSLKLITEWKERIDAVQKELDTNFSLSQAKRSALKKAMVMDRSRVIKEERKLSLTKGLPRPQLN